MVNARSTRLELPPEEMAQYSQLISQLAGGDPAEVVGIYKLAEGANSNTHLAVELGNGETYGLKAVTRVSQGCLREKVAADLAQLLAAPNACPCFITNVQFGPLRDKEVSVIRWLCTGCSLDKAPAEEVQASALAFFEQFGQWTLFCLGFGVSDRANPGNWVYDSQRQLLTMVDLEDAFTGAAQLNFVPWAVSQYADLALFMDVRRDYPPRDAFARGVIRMRGKFVALGANAREVIQRAGLVHTIPEVCYSAEAETVRVCLTGA